LPPDTLAQIVAAAANGITRIRHRTHLLFSFLDHTGLSL
jgi:hypothetical protein